MTVTVVQAQDFPSASSGSFTGNVTPGNSVVLVAQSFNASNKVLSSSSPKFAGSAVTGAIHAFDVQSAYSGGDTRFAAVWLLPDLAGGSAAVAVTVTNGTFGANIGLTAYEVAGLGATPFLDKTSTATNTTGSAVASGSTAALAGAPAFIVGCSQSSATIDGPLPSGWTNTTVGTAYFEAVGYQTAASPGGTYDYSAAYNGNGVWIAGAAAFSAAIPANGMAFLGLL
jgi:hypothetical protein